MQTGLQRWFVPTKTLWKLALLTAASVLAIFGLYAVAPCWTFEPFWAPISWFFGTLWPSLIPATLLLFVLSSVQVFKGSSVWILRVMWVGTILIIAYGWWASYISTYIWWKTTSGAPWPDFC